MTDNSKQPQLDARTLEAMRHLTRLAEADTYDVVRGSSAAQSITTVRAFLDAHDASTAAARDEDLALAIRDAYFRSDNGTIIQDWIEAARAALAASRGEAKS